jgi:predicted GNAT family N-acyltransferase
LLHVKLAQTEQEKELAFNIRKKVFVEEQGIPLHLEIDEFDQTATHFIVLEDDEPIAAARIRETESNVGKVERVCVLPEHRRKHLGVLVMNALEEHAKKNGWKKLKLNAQTYAIPFYEKLAYQVTSPEFDDAGIPHRAMEKEI